MRANGVTGQETAHKERKRAAAAANTVGAVGMLAGGSGVPTEEEQQQRPRGRQQQQRLRGRTQEQTKARSRQLSPYHRGWKVASSNLHVHS